MSDSVTPWTVACQAPLSMGFPRQQYWSRLPLPSPGDLPTLGIEPMSPELAGGFFTVQPLGKPCSLFLLLCRNFILCFSPTCLFSPLLPVLLESNAKNNCRETISRSLSCTFSSRRYLDMQAPT